MRLAAAAACSLVALAVAGCGQSDSEQISEAVGDLYGGLATLDGERVCDRLADEGRERLSELSAGGEANAGGVECARQVRITFAPYDARQLELLGRLADIRSLEIDGEAATAEVRRGEQHVTLAKRDGDWVVTDFGLRRGLEPEAAESQPDEPPPSDQPERTVPDEPVGTPTVVQPPGN